MTYIYCLIAFVLGAMLGGFLGVIMMSLMNFASHSEESEDEE